MKRRTARDKWIDYYLAGQRDALLARPTACSCLPNPEQLMRQNDVSKFRTLSMTACKFPAWLASLVLHLVAVAVLGALSIPAIRDCIVIEIYAEADSHQLSNDVLDFPLAVRVSEETAAPCFVDLPLNETAIAPASSAIVLDSDVLGSITGTPNTGWAFSGRSPSRKQEMLVANGGNKTTESAVRRGLDWLSSRQESDGGWKLASGYANPGYFEDRVAATAMALLAFHGAGNTHQLGDDIEVVKRGWRFLLSQQNKDGKFDAGSLDTQFYSQALATIVMCENYGMTKDKNIRRPAQKAIDYCYRTQSRSGGWRYQPYMGSDLSVTGWMVMALQSGRMAGLDVQSPGDELICKYLDSVAIEDGTRYVYQPGQGHGVSIPLTAEAILCRQYLGWRQDDPRLQSGVELIIANPIEANIRKQNVYYWYYATQVCYHMGGDHWNQWNQVMQVQIPAAQEMAGPEVGSWSPIGDRWGNGAGRLYQTCMSIYMLEVYYRHLPLYSYRLDADRRASK